MVFRPGNHRTRECPDDGAEKGGDLPNAEGEEKEISKYGCQKKMKNDVDGHKDVGWQEEKKPIERVEAGGCHIRQEWLTAEIITAPQGNESGSQASLKKDSPRVEIEDDIQKGVVDLLKIWEEGMGVAPPGL